MNLPFCDETLGIHKESDTVRFIRILMAPAAAFGSSFSMALQFVLLTPFLVDLGVDRTTASVIWLVGPTTGLIVQPLVGVLSDMYHRMHATRLPIVCWATSVLVCANLSIAFCESLSAWLNVSLIGWLVVQFWLFDGANNAIIVTMRAMLADRFGKEHRTFAFSVLQFWTSLGSISGFLVAAGTTAPTTMLLVQRCFLVCALIVAISTVLSALSVYEKRACRMRFHGRYTGADFRMNKVFLEPCLMAIVAGCVLTWFGWFAQQVFQSDFLTTRLEITDAAEGARLSALGSVIGAGMSCLTGLILPGLLAYTGTDSGTLFKIWATASAAQGAVLLVAPLLGSLPGFLVWEAATGPMFAVAMTVPFMLVASGCDHGSSGRIMALVNVAVCMPQLLVSVVGGVLAYETVFVAGGCLCLAAAKLLWVPPSTELPPWSQRSTASLIASNSDIYASLMENILFVDEQQSDFRLRGLSSPRITSPHNKKIITSDEQSPLL